jgi:hypothetical protein
MKYFTYSLIAAANDWIDQPNRARRSAQLRFRRSVERYHHELDELRLRLSANAWHFFRHGFAETGLHDARLLSLRLGDGLDYVPDGTKAFLLNSQKAAAMVELLSYEQDRYYCFQLRGVTKANLTLLPSPYSGDAFADLYTYELTGAKNSNLQLGLLFASGSEINIEHRRLILKQRRISRKYALDDIYK